MVARFKLKTLKSLTMCFPVDDVVRGILVIMARKEKWAHRDSTEKLEKQAEKEKQVWITNKGDCIYEYSLIYMKK